MVTTYTYFDYSHLPGKEMYHSTADLLDRQVGR